MNLVLKFIAFLICNAVGFFSTAICFAIGIYTGLISPDDATFDMASFERWFMTGVMVTWAICAVFSLAYFFIQGKMRFVFLLAPALVPLAYGLSVVFGSLSSL